jgi:3-isopropylmalate dehydrogenase
MDFPTPHAHRITLLPGDGIGPEVIAVAKNVLEEVASMFSIVLELDTGLIGACAVRETGDPLPEETLAKVRRSHAVLMGAVGGEQTGSRDFHKRPEAGLLALRKSMNLFANLRPVRVLPPLVACSPVKPEIVEGTDLVVVRELIGGLYFGEPRGRSKKGGEEVARNTMVYSESQIERVVRKAFTLAMERRKSVVSVDKANVLEVSLLWRDVTTRVHEDYPEVSLSHQYVDNCSMQLIRDPQQFDVIVTENLFGDILSDEAAVLVGSIGMLPSASLGAEGSLFEPVHGSAPDIAGRDVANPLGTILSVAMMFRYALMAPEAALWIEEAVHETLRRGYRTQDLRGSGGKIVGTREMGERVLEGVVNAGRE